MKKKENREKKRRRRRRTMSKINCILKEPLEIVIIIRVLIKRRIATLLTRKRRRGN